MTTTTTKDLKLSITLRDPRAQEIVESIPVKKRDETLEKYIILGDMVASHASISTSKEAVEEFFSPLRTEIETIREQLRMVVPIVKTPSTKERISVETVFKSFKDHFLDDSFEDVTRIGKFTDILATTSESKTPILIELKDYGDTVPTDQVEKFWRDLERQGAHYGLFISMKTGISKCSGCINLKTVMNRTAIFVNNAELNWSGHIFAFYVIKKIVEIESVKKKELKGQDISKVVAKVNKQVLELQKLIESINEIANIADKLKTTCKNNLEELIGLSNSLKRTMNDKVMEVLSELDKVEA